MSTLLVMISLLLTIGAAELVFRTALFIDYLPSLGLRAPWRYADADLDDDYWKLTYLFGASEQAQSVGYVDKDLGWGPRPISANSDNGINDPILFYGDSFVGGRDNIPKELDLILPKRSVINFGVGGYGVDQIYLKFEKTVRDFDDPFVLFGILTYDLDRSVLGIRTHQKPYFDIVNDRLVLRNTPVLATTQAYIDENPVNIRSYFMRFVLFRMRNFLSPTWFNSVLGYTENERKKRTVNRAILDALSETSTEIGIQPYVVLFYSGEEISTPTWRERFLKQTLAELSIEYFDTRSYLLEYMSASGVPLENLYREDFGHLNEKGRRTIAKGLAEWIDSVEAKD